MESPTVLPVDDDSSIQTILYLLLEEGGYNVLAAGNSLDALDICRRCRHPISLLLTDVTMPGMSGVELAEHGLLLQPLMKILFMSGDADNGSLHLVGFQGVWMFPAKPFDQAVLMSTVKRALGCQRNRAASMSRDQGMDCCRQRADQDRRLPGRNH